MSLFDLPSPPAYQLGNAPLVQALAQVRYPLVAAFETLAGVASLQEQLGESFPYMEQEMVQEVAFLVGPAGPAGGRAAESVNWKFTDDSGLLLTVSASSASLTAGDNYEGVERFATVFASLLNALKSARVQRCDRLGVRYLSVASDLPGEQSSWKQWFNPELVGWVGSPVVPQESLTMAIQQVQLSHPATGDLAGPPADVQTVVRHGAVPGGTSLPGIPPITVQDSSYLLDVDVFTAGVQPFDPNALTAQFRQFHSQIDRLFYWALSDGGREHFELTIRQN